MLAAIGKELVLVAFDRDGAAAAGYPVRRLDVALLLLIEVAVVTSVPAVGTLQSVALIVAPAAAARLWVSRVVPMTALAVGIGVASGVAGVLLSRAVDVAAGGAVVLVLAAVFAVSVLLSDGGPVRRRAMAALQPNETSTIRDQLRPQRG